MTPIVVVCVEIALSLLPHRRRLTDIGSRPRIAVLIPAHDESAVIKRTLESIMPQLCPFDRVVVVADNCSDDTAAVARAEGAEAIVRTNTIERGKGFALDFGVKHLASDPPRIVILVDADVTLRPGGLEQLARQARISERPAQGIYILREAPSADGRDVVSHLAFVVRNHVRPLGLARIGGPCPLFGAGMAFPWDLIKNAPLASGNIVEDMALGLDLARQGRAAMLCPESFIDGTLPKAHDAASKQRRRWEHGHLRTIFYQVPQVFLSGIARLHARTLMLALDMSVPPLSLLVFLTLLATFACMLLAATTPINHWPAIVLAAGMLGLLLSLVIAWKRFSTHDSSLRPLLSAPSYMFRKLPMYFAFFTRRGEKSWNRTDREV